MGDFHFPEVPETEGERKAAQTRCPPGWVWEKSVNRKGIILEERWTYTEPRKPYPSNGLAYLPPYLDQLVTSECWFSSVSVATIDGEEGFSLHHREGRIELLAFFTPEKRELEPKSRRLLEALGYPVVADYLAQSTRVLTWELPKDAAAVLKTVRLFAGDVLGIPEEAGLAISFEEHEDRRQKFAGEREVTGFFTHPIEDPTAPPPL